MKFNQWTLGLAAVGAVSLVSAARADEAKVSQVQTALSATTLSGYVDVAAQYNPGNNSYEGQIAPGQNITKLNNFSVNTVNIALDKPQDESPWASGYHVELNWGTDEINALGNSFKETAIRQAYVTLRTPVGNGIDWKVGAFDNIIGYEGNTDAANPNYTRSYGYTVEPTSYVGLLGTYKFNSAITAQAGIADVLGNNYYGVSPLTQTVNISSSAKAYLAALALTAPDSWGWLKGATLNLGFNDQNFGNISTGTVPHSQQNYYAGLTLPTPISALKFGFAFDYVNFANQVDVVNQKDDSIWIGGVYATYQATDKLSLNLRGEYDKDDHNANQGEEATATIQYNLWANVTSRVEFRWDHVAHGTQYGTSQENANSYLAALNLIYTF
jgi:Putative beta-barrel porin-2, OmpL-like. bbp2